MICCFFRANSSQGQANKNGEWPHLELPQECPLLPYWDCPTYRDLWSPSSCGYRVQLPECISLLNPKQNERSMLQASWMTNYILGTGENVFNLF